MPTHTRFKGVEHISTSLITDQLESNTIGFFQWGSLCIGGFFDVNLPQEGLYGGDQHLLRPVSDPNYSEGQVWEGFRKDWVWEHGVDYDTQPISVSGVYVDDVFQPGTGIGSYAHYIDYPNGRVIFETPISTSSDVGCEYSYRLYSWQSADHPSWRKFQEDSFKQGDHYYQSGSGDWDILSANRIQLPSVFVEAVLNAKRRPLEIGNSSQVVRQDILCHIVGESRWQTKQMHDILTTQKDKRIHSFDKNLLYDNNAFPIDEYGRKNESGLMYPELVDEYLWKQLRCVETSSVEHPVVPPLYYSTVRMTFEVDSV